MSTSRHASVNTDTILNASFQSITSKIKYSFYAQLCSYLAI